MNGTHDSRVAAWETSAKSWASCTEPDASRPNPVARAAITSWWSPKIEIACADMARLATWITQGSSSPATLNMLGIISMRPCDDVKLVTREPVMRAPCSVPAEPISLCISMTSGTVPQMFFLPSLDHWSASSAMEVAGVMGKIEQTSFTRNATLTHASLPSRVAVSVPLVFFVGAGACSGVIILLFPDPWRVPQ